jgi:hypothetical protein
VLVFPEELLVASGKLIQVFALGIRWITIAGDPGWPGVASGSFRRPVESLAMTVFL